MLYTMGVWESLLQEEKTPGLRPKTTLLLCSSSSFLKKKNKQNPNKTKLTQKQISKLGKKPHQNCALEDTKLPSPDVVPAGLTRCHLATGHGHQQPPKALRNLQHLTWVSDWESMQRFGSCSFPTPRRPHRESLLLSHKTFCLRPTTSDAKPNHGCPPRHKASPPAQPPALRRNANGIWGRVFPGLGATRPLSRALAVPPVTLPEGSFGDPRSGPSSRPPPV